MHDVLLLINTCSSFYMMGLIWFVQVVHYPAFRNFERSKFRDVHHAHVFNTGMVVIPVMLIELGTSILLSIFSSQIALINRMGLGIVLLIWLSTFLLQVPIHDKLRKGFDENLIRRLVRTNWTRTVLWTIKGLLSLSGTCYLLIN